MSRILFIEPDRILGANARRIFKRAGHTVDWHVDPQAAMDAADAAHPDIIILDLVMAGRSGVEFLHELRSYPDWAKLPVIIYSTIPPEDFNLAASSAVALDITAYYYKPTTSIKQLCQSIKRTLQPAVS